MRNAINVGQFDHLVSQQTQGPLLVPRRRLRLALGQPGERGAQPFFNRAGGPAELPAGLVRRSQVTEAHVARCLAAEQPGQGDQHADGIHQGRGGAQETRRDAQARRRFARSLCPQVGDLAQR